jgi:putative multicomponent Na+:H+ antiporter subunit B
MTDIYIYVITALLPLSAVLVVLQVNPYHALVIRGILGAVAALTYAMFGAADVALTEALVGTMLAITLYGVAVRSSMVMRLGRVENEATKADDTNFQTLINRLREILAKYHLRLELVSYDDQTALDQALIDKEVHGICQELEGDRNLTDQSYQTITRVQRLYEILKPELSLSVTNLTYSDEKENF